MTNPREYTRIRAMRSGDPTPEDWDGRERRASYRNAIAVGAKALDVNSIFRQMIVSEIKNGTLSPWRRRRIVRYAAKLGLTAVQAGEVLEECRIQAMQELGTGRKQLRLSASTQDDTLRIAWGIVAMLLALAFLTNVVLSLRG